uniref:C-type lectin domain-containing protein n=1 Tax=Electrophorus electricus TaxID=8005 RepID=A0AAY5ELQ4_ELEEL
MAPLLITLDFFTETGNHCQIARVANKETEFKQWEAHHSVPRIHQCLAAVHWFSPHGILTLVVPCVVCKSASLIQSTLGECGSGWRTYQERCYFFSTDTKTWHDALTECENKGANLMSIQDIHERIQSVITGVSLWIGGHDSITEGGWEWADRSPFRYINWASEPNNHGGRENCVEMVTTNNGSSYWNDVNCDAHQDWVCMIAKGKIP